MSDSPAAHSVPEGLERLAGILQDKYGITTLLEEVDARHRLLVAHPLVASARVLVGSGWFWWGWGEPIAAIEDAEPAASIVSERFCLARILGP